MSDEVRSRVARHKRADELVADIRRLDDRIDAAVRQAVYAKTIGCFVVPPAYAQHERVWWWAKQVDAERQDAWTPPLARCWR